MLFEVARNRSLLGDRPRAERRSGQRQAALHDRREIDLDPVAALQADLQQTLEWGLYPFIVGGVIKAVIAALVLRGAWALVGRADATKQG